MSKKRIKVIACKVMLRQLYRLAAESENIVDILWMEQELHNTPDSMRVWLQKTIDRIEETEQPYDAIVLAYGLCSNGTVGLRAKKTPLIIPRAHDCITLLLGDRRRYAELFEQNSGGVYWYSQGWVECTLMPGKERYDLQYADYLEKYGEDNAQYLMEMEQGWMREYRKAIYIRWPGDGERDEQKTKDAAAYLKWEYEGIQGDTSLLRALVDGPWDEGLFLVLPSGQPVAASNDPTIVKAGSIT